MRGSFNGPQRPTEVQTPAGRKVIEKIMAERPPTPAGQHRR